MGKILRTYFEYAKCQKINSNLIHYAIDGKKISFLKIILNLSRIEVLWSKNKVGDTLMQIKKSSS